MAPLLEIRELRALRLGHPLLRGINLRMSAGESVVIGGENGAGKTTLLDLIGGDVHIDSGDVRLNGVQINRHPPWRRARQGLLRLYQDIGIFGELTVMEALSIAPLACGQERLRPERAVALLDELQLPVSLGQRCADLSVGQQRLLAIARILAGEPKVALLDEPAAGLSDASKAALTGHLLAYSAKRACAFLVVEHDDVFLARYPSRRLQLRDGQLWDS